MNMDNSASPWASSSTLHPYNTGHRPSHTSPMLSSTASHDLDDEFEQPQLTLDCRRRPHSPLPPSPTISSDTQTNVAISFSAHNTTTTKRQDVRPLLNSASRFRPPSPAPRFHGFSIAPLESPLSSVSHPDQHVAINSDSTRPRTTIFASSKDLAAHYGIPQNLPPPPRPIAHRPPPPKQTKSSPPPPDFSSTLGNYLTMLAQKPTDPNAAADSVPATVTISSEMDALEKYIASPEFRNLGDSFDSPVIGEDSLFDVNAYTADFGNEPLFGDDSPYLTSPQDHFAGDDFGTSPMDTPFSEFMPTPVMAMANDFESPLITDRGFDDTSLDLFGAAPAFPTFEFNDLATAPAPKAPNTGKLWTFSPSTPALDSIEPSSTVKNRPVVPAPPAPAGPAPTRRRTAVTGTRKNLRPEALIPLDAPTQKRTYVTPSATSRKAVPAAVAKKRLHSVAFDDAEEEELGVLSPTASEAETIEYKRRQNTIAARKSRKRKLEHQQMLEDEVQTLQSEVAVWRERAMMGQEMLRSHGIMFSFDGQQQS
ncbi:hypothetical protein C8R43DRAFT_1024407 [Mycena crocata]|nr:hypothetical protein C8R43DRAFT_1024407 [Mycena crocata]